MKQLRDGGSNQRALVSGLNLRRLAAMAAIALLSLVGLLLAEVLVDAAAEDPVGGLVLTSDEPGVLAISWDPHDPLPTDYRVNWSKTGEDFPSYREEDGNAYPTTNSQTVSGLEPGVEYQVRVRARYYDSDGRLSSGDWSETASLTVAEPAPDDPLTSNAPGQDSAASDSETDNVQPAAEQSEATTLVSNVDQERASSLILSNADLAQGFRTGEADNGYRLTTVELSFSNGSQMTAPSSVTLHEDSPTGARVAAFAAPERYVDGTNTFAAPAGAMLQPQTRYYIVIAGGDGQVDGADGGDEDSESLDDWLIEDAYYTRQADSTAETKFQAHQGPPTPRLLRVSGTAMAIAHELPDADGASDSGPRSSHVATLSALVVAPVASGAPPVALSPAFRPAKLKYTAALESDSIIVTATATNGAASVVLTDGETTGTDEATTFDLGLGVTTILVTVTSADGTSSAAYEITITRTMSISFVAAEYEVTEGQSVSVEWELSGKPREYLHVPLVSTNEGNVTGDDWDMTLRLTIAPLSEEIRFRFQALQDSDDDDGEHIVLGFGELPAYVTVGTIDQATVRIIDDDGLAPSERPVIMGTPQVGEILTVDTSGITNPNGVSDEGFTYAWYTKATTKDGVVDSFLYNGCSEFPVSWPYEGEGLRVRVDYKDDLGNFHIVNSAWTTKVTPPALPASTQSSRTSHNFDRPSWYPTITGDLIAGGTLTFDISGIERVHPEPTSDYCYTWWSSDPIDHPYLLGPPDLPGEHDQTLTLTGDHVGFDIAGDVSFRSWDYRPVIYQVRHEGPVTAVPTVTFAPASLGIREGNSEVIRVLLNAEPMQPLTIPIVVQPNDGITTDDYSGVPMSVTFAQGQKEQSFTVAALLDQEIEGNDENFRLEFGDLPSGVAVGDVGSVRVWLNDEQAGGVVTVTGGQTPEVGQVLTAVTTGVVSEHGLTQAVYAYQWRRLLTAAFALHKEIDGATDATYTPTLADAGNRLYMVVHITDDAGKVSRIDSAATSPVADNSDDVLFSNWTVATDHIVTVGTRWEDEWAFPFGTGDHPSGYFLSSVNIATTYWGDSLASISIWSARTLEHGEIVPDIPVILLVLPQPRTQETVPLTAPEGSWLAPDTTYFLVLHEDRRGSLLAMVSTLEIELDPATDAGWSYGNRTARRERLWETHAPGVYGPWRAFNYGGTQSSPRPKFSLKGEKADLDVVTVSFAQPSYEVDEGGTVTVTVELDADPDSELVIPLRLTEVGASSADYTDVPEFLTFPDGVRTQTFTVRAVDDTEVEDDESLSLAFGMLPPGVAAGAAGAETTIEIIDNDVDEEEDEGEKVKIWFELAELTGLEGTEREIKVQMTLAPGDYVTIPITTENLDGASSDDYSGIPQEITFGPNDSEKAFRVSFTDDSIDDDDERVRLGFGSLPDWLAVGNPSESTILIYDNDDPEVTVSFAQSSYTVGEGGTVMVTVELNADPERTLMIPITRTSTNGAARPTDYRVPGNVTFLENETSKTITFTAIDDTDDDDDESVQLSFGNLPDRVFGGTPSATEVAIIDDDDPFVRVSFGESSYTVGEGGDGHGHG